jgi:hypothetical protein
MWLAVSLIVVATWVRAYLLTFFSYNIIDHRVLFPLVVDMERMYSTLGLLVRKYQKRGMIVRCTNLLKCSLFCMALAATAPLPPPVIYMPTIGQRGKHSLLIIVLTFNTYIRYPESLCYVAVLRATQ